MTLRGIAFLFDNADSQDIRVELEQVLQRLGFVTVPIRNTLATDASTVDVGQIREIVAKVESVMKRAESANDMDGPCRCRGGDRGASGGGDQAEFGNNSRLVEVDENNDEAGDTIETAEGPEAVVSNALDEFHDVQKQEPENEAFKEANAVPEPNPIELRTESAEKLDADVTFDKPGIVETTEEDVLNDDEQLEARQEVAEADADPWTTEELAEAEPREDGRLSHHAVEEWVSAASMATAPEHRVASILEELSQTPEPDIGSTKEEEEETHQSDTIAGDITPISTDQTSTSHSHGRVTSSERWSRDSRTMVSTSTPRVDEAALKTTAERVRRRKKYKYIVREEIPRQGENRPEPDILGRKTAAGAKPRAASEKKSRETRTLPGWLAAVLT